MHIIEIEELIISLGTPQVLDVRSEGEFQQGHIPGAVNIPLLNNKNRRLVGICYKERGNEAAVLLGYELVGGQFSSLIQNISRQFPNKKVTLHCWRGGLRSRIVAQLLGNAGFEVSILKGGYKSYRHWVLDKIDQPLNIKIIGGLTGSGKTELLHQLQLEGEQIIDLEGLAHHKGSTFGGINQKPQPTQEQFENELASVIQGLNPSHRVWVEDESRRIGNNCLSEALWNQMRDAEFCEIILPENIRLKRIINEYGNLPKDLLLERTSSLKKRLGDKHLKEILKYLLEGNITAWAAALLQYYDKNYLYGQSKRELISKKKIEMEEEWSGEKFLKFVNP